ncbi:MAG TPA: hypothetical protein VF400_00355 [Anaeromyxobacteraceae bacterium]
MRAAILTLAVALSAPAAFAQQEPASAAQAGETSDGKKEDPQHIKSYGFGTPPGVESNASAGQAVQKKRPKSKAPQDEERAPKKKKKAKKTPATPSQPGSAAQQQGDPQK